MAHAVVRLDNMQGTHDGTKLRSLKYFTTVETVKTATAIDNGCVVKLSALMTDEREVWEAGNLAAGDKKDVIVLVADPEVMYDERLRNLSDFTNEAGKVVRGYCLCQHDTWSATVEAFDGTPTVGAYLEAKAGNVLKVASAATNAVAKCTAIEKVGSLTFYVIEVL